MYRTKLLLVSFCALVFSLSLSSRHSISLAHSLNLLILLRLVNFEIQTAIFDMFSSRSGDG